MGKRIYISADYDEYDGDRDVVEILNKWGTDNLHKIDFVDMSKVKSGTIARNPDCRPCDLKQEFNRQINASSAVIIIVGSNTRTRIAGSNCLRSYKHWTDCSCTPYKQNTSGSKLCKEYLTFPTNSNDDVGSINTYSYLRHEFEQARHRNKPIIVLYNSLRKEPSWLPSYLKEYADIAHPFWKYNIWGDRVGNYEYIKGVLGYV